MSREDRAEELFRSGFNCAQSVVGVFCEELGIDTDTAMKLTECFGGGFSRLRLVCGAVSGMGIVAGMALSRGAGEGNTRAAVYGKTQELAERFRANNGSIICAELLGIDKDKDGGMYASGPEKRTEAYYKKRPCIQCIRECVRLAEEGLKEQLEDNAPPC